VVTAHGVDGDADAIAGIRVAAAQAFKIHEPLRLGGRLRLGLALDADGLAAVVPTTVGAGVVGTLLLVAVRALFELRRSQRVVRAALALTGV
jgi:hypothetical protein